MALLLASDGGVYVREKLLPCVGMLYVVFGAVFALLVGIAVQSMYVIVADHVGRVKMIFATQPGDQADHRAVGCIDVLTCGIGVADLNGNSVFITVVCGGRSFIKGKALNYLALKTHNKMGAYGSIGLVEIIPVVFSGGVRIANVMNHYIVDLGKLKAGS